MEEEEGALRTEEVSQILVREHFGKKTRLDCGTIPGARKVTAVLKVKGTTSKMTAKPKTSTLFTRNRAGL